MYELGEDEFEAIKRVLSTKKLLRYQRNKGECDLFEREFADFLKTDYALMVTSGTNALALALKSLDIGIGDEVLIPSYTFVATAVAVVNVGATPIVVDINENLTLDLSEAKKQINSKTKAMIIVHMDGLNCNMEAVKEFSVKNNLLLIEDCAQALGGHFKGKRLGTWGDVGCFSFNVDKIISCGEGGAVVTNDQRLHKKMFVLHDPSTIFHPYTKEMLSDVEHVVGNSMRVSEISAAMMRAQLKKLPHILNRLNSIKQVYRSTLKKWAILTDDFDGDCGTAIHLKLQSPDLAQLVGNQLRMQGIVAAPPTARPAHIAFKWRGLIFKDNPLLQQAPLLQTIDIISKVIKVDLSYDLDLTEHQNIANNIQKVILSSQ